jgi:bacteriocin-like protein
MKKLNTTFKVMSKEDLKAIVGGAGLTPETCIVNGAPCNESLQCCSVNCVVTGTGPTGKICMVS